VSRTSITTRLATMSCWLLMLVVLGAAGEARAHSLEQSYLYLQISEQRMTGRFEIAIADLNQNVDLDGTGLKITPYALDDRVGALKKYMLEHVTISDSRGPLTIEFTGHSVLRAHGWFVLLPFTLEGRDAVPERLTIDYSVLFDEAPDHRGFLIVEHNWATGTFANENRESLVFTPDSRRQEFEVTSSGRWRGFTAIVRLGIHHILTGYDHVMFLIALLLPAVMRREDGRWRPVDRFAPALSNAVKIVAAFIVAHSLAIGLAAVELVRPPERLVEAVIGVSVGVAAANILVPMFRNRVWVAAFAFGLVHGFGFARYLAKLGVLGDHLGLSLLGFNLGLAIGQVVIVAVLLPVLYAIRSFSWYRRPVLAIAAAVMILFSCAWIVERSFGLDFQMTKRAKSAVHKVFP
jgi:hypothetical protein